MTPLRRIFFRNTAPPGLPDGLRPGAFYVHEGERGALEMARIIDVATDKLGVSHIRFELIYRYRHKTMSAGERTLAFASFRQRFQRRLDDDEHPPL